MPTKAQDRVRELHFSGPSGNLGWLDPRYPCRVTIDGIVYRSAEHYYQSRKARSDEDRAWIADAPDAGEARRRANSLSADRRVENWDGIRLAAWYDANLAKFFQNDGLGRKLKETGTVKICEERTDDKFWGWPGENMAGELLMRIRGELPPV